MRKMIAPGFIVIALFSHKHTVHAGEPPATPSAEPTITATSSAEPTATPEPLSTTNNSQPTSTISPIPTPTPTPSPSPNQISFTDTVPPIITMLLRENSQNFYPNRVLSPQSSQAIAALSLALMACGSIIIKM